nr:zinc finger, GRF-type [Tanacetum cinerariifolium]
MIKSIRQSEAPKPSSGPHKARECLPLVLILRNQTQMPQLQGTNCGIVDWYDPPMYARSVQIIPGLLRNMNGLQAMVATKQVESRRLKMMLGFSWLVIVLYFLLN